MEGAPGPNAERAGALVLGLAFLWQMFRHACLTGAFPSDGPWDEALPWTEVYYILVLVLSAVGAIGRRLHRRTLPVRVLGGTCACVASIGVACSTLLGLGGVFATALSVLVVVSYAVAVVLLTCWYAGAMATVCRNEPRTILVCALASCFLSIVVTFVFADLMGLSHALPIMSPAFAFILLALLERKATPVLSEPDGGVPEQGIARFDCLGVVVLLGLATLLKGLCDGGIFWEDAGVRMVKHFVGIAELAAMLALAYLCKRIERFAALAPLVIAGGLVTGCSLIAAGVGGNVGQTGLATISTARVVAEGCALAYAVMWTSGGDRSRGATVCAVVLVPEFACAAVGYGSAPLLAFASAEGLPVVPWASLAVVTCIALYSIVRLGVSEPAGTPEGTHLAEPSAVENDDEDLLPAQIDRALAAIARQYGLTRREADVARYLYRGLGAKAIAEKEYLSINTVQTHCKALYSKLGIHSRKELVEAVDTFVAP